MWFLLNAIKVSKIMNSLWNNYKGHEQKNEVCKTTLPYREFQKKNINPSCNCASSTIKES